jgi:hypothetical protein
MIRNFISKQLAKTMHKTSTKRTKNAYDRQQKSDENIELYHTNYKL